MLLYVGGEILEIRPKQIIKTKEKLDYPQLTLIEEKKRGRPKKKVEIDGDKQDISKTEA
tara:strand:- start:1146 stop:1322 length:177 start_codon:yes stop_codon:yes gene_type:complete